MRRKLEGAEKRLVNIMVRFARGTGDLDGCITDALGLLQAERSKAAKEVLRVLRHEIEDANSRITAKETNPLYWLDRRFRQLANEIENDCYGDSVQSF